MSIIQPMLAELEYEISATRKVLERAPEEKFDWKPHEKSMSLRELTSHVSNILQWVEAVMTVEEFEVPSDFKPFRAESRAELLSHFDQNVARARELLSLATDEQLKRRWRFKSEGRVKFEMSRVAVLRSFILNHLIHHRGQLSVYLRLSQVPVPAIYGPSADEPA